MGSKISDYYFTLVLAETGRTIAFDYKPTLCKCGVQYACVEWVSFTGVTRRHVFEVIKNKIDVGDSYSLLMPDNSFSDIRGRKDSFTLFMDGLNAYDLWYYADLITSPSVKVSLNSERPATIDFHAVQVTTKNITIPDGDYKSNGKLEITVNWKQYDAVAL